MVQFQSDSSSSLRAHALQVWAESRERVADELLSDAGYYASLGQFDEAARLIRRTKRLATAARREWVEIAELRAKTPEGRGINLHRH